MTGGWSTARGLAIKGIGSLNLSPLTLVHKLVSMVSVFLSKFVIYKGEFHNFIDFSSVLYSLFEDNSYQNHYYLNIIYLI